MREILLGDEAVSRGAIDAGLSAAYAYPGTPSTEIFESLQAYVKEHRLPIRGLWSTNEKVALEEAIGVSYCGKRAMVSMKHVGLNVAADPFMNVAVSGAWGGLVLAVADDPSMHSSQNEQDSRHFADFAQVPCFEPADQQQAYDFTREAFELSEKLRIPVLLRLVTRLAHSRALVELAARKHQNELRYVEDAGLYTLIPTNARKAYAGLLGKQEGLQRYSSEHPANALTIAGEGKKGILVSGVAWNYLVEALGSKLADYNVLRIGVYPLPVAKMRELLDRSCELTIVEEGYPFIERYVSALGLFREKPVKGRMTGDVPRAGELSPDVVRKTFGLPVRPSMKVEGVDAVLAGRPPRLCDACPHGDSYDVINTVMREVGEGTRVMGDIGCYALGYLKPYQAIHSCLCMGSSIGMAIGAAHAGINPSLCVIGDGTFTHSGMTAMLDAANEDSNIKVFILDNSIVAMTGGQPTSATDEQVVDLVAGLGVPRKHIRVITPVPHAGRAGPPGALGDHRPARVCPVREGDQGQPAGTRRAPPPRSGLHRVHGELPMNFDLVLCGVGGQGVLSTAWVIDHAAVEAGLHFKQPEVHGMAQRGGAVSAQVRLSDQPVSSDLISEGCASVVLSVEPLEGLRYLPLLSADGWIVTDVTPLKNIANYPPLPQLYEVLFSAPRVVVVDATRLAARAGAMKAQNMVVLGAAASHLPLPVPLLEKHLAALFTAKGERVVEANLRAFRMGQAAAAFGAALLALGIKAGLVARVVPRLDFDATPVPEAAVKAWAERLSRPDGAELASRVFASRDLLGLGAQVPAALS